MSYCSNYEMSYPTHEESSSSEEEENSSGDESSGDESEYESVCQRCGRDSHNVDDCYASKDVHGYIIGERESPAKKRRKMENNTPKSGVYVLELSGNNFYVGRSEDIQKRLTQHMSGNGSAWTKEHPMIREIAPITQRIDDLDSWERAETLELASIHGVDRVRGHVWTSKVLTAFMKRGFVTHIRDRKNLCRRCGKPGHMISHCRSEQNFDVV